MVVGPEVPVKLDPIHRSQRKGSTLVLVLILGALFGLLVFSTIGVANNTSDVELERKNRTLDFDRAESAAALLRLELINHYEGSGLGQGEYLQQIMDDLTAFAGGSTGPWTSTAPGTPGGGGVRSYPAFPGVEAWIDRASNGSQGNWCDIVAANTAPAATGRSPQSVRTRIQVGQSSIFNLAFLTVTTNCMFCHLQINGDMGSIGHFQPSHDGTQNQSLVNGNLYAATTVNLNGTPVSGAVNTNYTGPFLPKDTDGDGVADFPTLDPAEARSLANGKLFVGTSNSETDGSGVWIVPMGSGGSAANFDPLTTVRDPSTTQTWRPDTAGEFPSVVEGNLVLVGTAAHPINLDRDVFASGDVVIKGYVTGRGGVYAGRNVYIAGDVVYANPPSTWPIPAGPTADQDAQDAVSEGRDELRVAARENIVVGDWTYRKDTNSNGVEEDTATETVGHRDRQATEFMWAQFNIGGQRYYKKSNGTDSSSEVRLVGGVYKDDQDMIVPASEVVSVLANNPSTNTIDQRFRAYDVNMAPGQVESSGTFNPWMSSAQYDGILSTETYEAYSWRFPRDKSNDMMASTTWSGPRSAADYEAEMGTGSVVNGGAGLAPGDSIGAASADMSTNQGWFSQNEFGANDGVYFKRAGGTNYVADYKPGGKQFQTQVSRIDGFLYANKRLAGLTSTTGLQVNGGLVATEIGILDTVSQFRVNNPVSGFHQIRQSFIHATCPNKAAFPVNGPATLANATDRFTVNYDYRLRNGGYGFNLINGNGTLLMYVRGRRVTRPSY